MCELWQQPGPAAGAPALHRARRDAQNLRGIRHRVAEHVHHDQRGPLVRDQRAQRGQHVQRDVLVRGGLRGPGQQVQVMLPPATGRAARRRIRSRQAFTTIRCSQVVTAESPRKSAARRNAEIIASCRASAASSASPIVRSATAHKRSRWRRNNWPNASASPVTWRRSNSASDGSACGTPHPPDSAGPRWPATGQPDPRRTAPETNASNLLPPPASGGSLVNQIST